MQADDVLPHGKVLAGGDGIVDWEVKPSDPDLITVRFQPLRCVQCAIEMESNSLVEYRIIWSTDELWVNYLGKCDNVFTDSLKKD
jgi:hypothetical protein